jgi:D-amino-acid dehydrogenase
MRSGIDVVVIGTGIAGASVAYSLARRGMRVTTADAHRPGQATAASAGILEPWSGAEEDEGLYRLQADATRYYPTLLRRLSEDGIDDVGYARNGALVVSESSRDLDAVESRVSGRAIGEPSVGSVSRLTGPEARELFPALARELGAVHISGAARVDGGRLRRSLLQAAARHGATSLEGNAEVVITRSRTAAVLVAGRKLESDAVVIAAGAWTNQVLAPLGLRVPVEPQRGQIIQLRLEDVDSSAWPSVLPLTPHYIVSFDDSRIAVGVTRESGSGFDPRITAGGQRLVLDAALAVAPGLADATYLETRVGLRPLASDQRPHVGPVPGVDGLVVCTGFGPVGLTLGPWMGELVADMVEGARAPEHAGLEPRFEDLGEAGASAANRSGAATTNHVTAIQSSLKPPARR